MTTKVDAQLSIKLKEALAEFLKEHMDIFVWPYEDIPKTDPGLMVHEFNVNPNYKLIRKREEEEHFTKICTRKSKIVFTL